VPTGTLVVDLVDCPSGKLAWRGAVSDELARDPGKADRKAEKSISKLFDELPSAAD
jgi:hypothetical protein